MKDYLKKIVKNRKFTKVIKLFLIAFTLIIVIDAINLPSSLIKRFNLMFLIVVIVGFFTLGAVFLIENHFCDLLKEKAINEFDSYLLLSMVGSIIYILLLATTPLFKCYKLIAICAILLLLLLLFIYRINLARVKNSNKLNNTNIYDLKDFIENDITIVNEYPVLFAEKDVDYDLCDRSSIINQLYSSLQACRSSEYSFVIGLEGPWGSGKTTIINNVIAKIRQESDEYIIINDFDPWIYSSQQALLTSLFDKILKNAGIKYSNSSLKAISNNLVKSIVGIHVAGSIAGSILFQENAEEDILDMKERINTSLEQSDKTIIIFIDNLDRASADNIILLLKIISNVFDLRRIVYVLSYDKARVNEILNCNLHINKHYIEKIVQKEIKVPKLNRDMYYSIVSDCLNKLLDIYSIPKDKQKDFLYIIDFLANSTDDIREFKRIMNSVGATLSIKNDLYKPDLFTIELIRFLDNDLYDEIHENFKFYISSDMDKNSELYQSVFNRDEFNKEGKDYFDKVRKNYDITLLKLLSNIFPYVDKYLNKNELRPQYDNNAERNKKIALNCGVASAKYFDLYFNYGKNEYVGVSMIYNKLVHSLYQEKENDSIENIPNLFNILFDNIPIYYHAEIINKLWFARKDFDKVLIFQIFIGLIKNVNKLDKEAAIFVLNPYNRACAILADLFSQFSNDEKFDLIDRLKNRFNLIYVCDEMLYWLDSLPYYDKKEQDAKLMEDMIIDMYRTITERPIDIYSEENYAYHNSWALLRTKRKVLKLEKNADVEMREYISKIMKPHYVYKILRDIIGTSTGTNGYGYYINENSLKSFFTDENVLSDYLQLCPPSDEIEKFICNIFNKYKNDEVDEMEEKAIYVDHYIRLW